MKYIYSLISIFIVSYSFSASLHPLENASYEVGFANTSGHSPKSVVLDAIHSAKKEILVATHTLNNSSIVKELIAAHKKNIKIMVLFGESKTLKKDGSLPKNSKLKELSKNQILYRIVPKSIYISMHNSFMVIDGNSVQTGSFEYSNSSEKHNAENTLFLANVPEIATLYKAEFDRLWEKGHTFNVK